MRRLSDSAEGEGHPRGQLPGRAMASFNPSNTVTATGHRPQHIFPTLGAPAVPGPGQRQGPICSPAGFRPGLCVAIQGPLPDAVGQCIAHRGHDGQQLRRPIIEVQGADPGQVSPQVPVDS